MKNKDGLQEYASEEDMERNVEIELIEPSKELAIKVKEFNLAPTDAVFLLGKHEHDFKNVAIWAKKASKIIVTDESQKVIMEEARTGRLFLASIRNEVERNRKALKEQSLKRGKAIDGVANFIKDLIIPTEEHLRRQEDFIELKKKAEDERILAEAYAKQEAEIKAKEEADKVALAKAQEENRKLQKEVEQARKEAEALKQKEDKAKEEQIRQAQIQKNGTDVAKIQKLCLDLEMVTYPEVVGVDAKGLILDARNHVRLSVMKLKEYLKTNAIEEEV